MNIEVAPAPPGTPGDYMLVFHRPGGRTAVGALTGHDLNDLEAILAQRKAMARTCPSTKDEHTCGLPPGPHYAHLHVCRACPETWRGSNG